MTLNQALKEARDRLAAAAVADGDLEAEVLLRHLLGCDRARLYLEAESEISTAKLGAYRRLVRRRAAREPTAYITGHREFYGLDFAVDHRVLIPRPETEHLVMETLQAAAEYPPENGKNLRIAEAGTGSGAVAVTLAVHLRNAEIHAGDISGEALRVARRNARRHGVAGRIRFHRGDLLAGIPGKLDIIVANLPYVSAAEMAALEPEISRFEPLVALSGGKDGLKEIRRLVRTALPRLKPGGRLLLEIGEGQGRDVTRYLRRRDPGAMVTLTPDMAGRERIVSCRLPAAGHVSALIS